MKYLLLNALTRLLSLIPARGLEWISCPLGRLAWALGKTKRNSTLTNLAACYPDLSGKERVRLGRASMRHYIMTALETGICWHWKQAAIQRLFEAPVGLEQLEKACASGSGVLLLIPHQGNWELLNHWLQFRAAVIALYKPGRYPDFEARLLSNRERFGAEMTPITRAGLKLLYQRLRASHVVLVLPDQDPSEGQGRFAPFFGIPALTGVLASRLAQQAGCPAMFAVCKREKGGRYRVHFIPAADAFYAPDLDVSLEALNRGVEQCIDLDPQQYLWAYKRFKSRPEGEPRFY
jgi:KDO2-lipid IV(A) lauroyltransferase